MRLLQRARSGGGGEAGAGSSSGSAPRPAIGPLLNRLVLNPPGGRPGTMRARHYFCPAGTLRPPAPTAGRPWGRGCGALPGPCPRQPISPSGRAGKGRAGLPGPAGEAGCPCPPWGMGTPGRAWGLRLPRGAPWGWAPALCLGRERDKGWFQCCWGVFNFFFLLWLYFF